MKIRIEKEKYASLAPLYIGHSNAKFYGYLYVDSERVGTVWKFKDTNNYICNEDFNRSVHCRENRPRQFKGSTLAILKENIKNNW